ncbi:MAG: right-handed parallel beta-helix repeat-containing protein [Myxococcota bacterium]
MMKLWWLVGLSACVTVLPTPCDNNATCEAAFGDGYTCVEEVCQAPEEGVTVPPLPVPKECEDLTAPVAISGTIDGKTVWRCTNVPYVISSSLTVTGSLSVDPGVTIQMTKDSALIVEKSGDLDMAGTSADPIRVMGPTNTAGEWVGIIVRETAGPVSLINVLVRGAGAPGTSFGITDSERAAVIVFNEAKIIGTQIEDSSAHGIRFAREGRANEFETNAITNTAWNPIRIEANQVGSLSGSHTFTPDAKIEVDPELLDTSATWEPLGAPYVVGLAGGGSLEVGVPSSDPPLLTLAPGVRIEFAPKTSFKIGNAGGGGLIARGTEALPIILTSALEEPAPGDWSGLLFASLVQEDQAELSYVTIEYAGTYDLAGLTVWQSQATLRMDHSTIRRHIGEGASIGGKGSSAVITETEFSENGEDGLTLYDGVMATVDECDFINNGDEGISVAYGGDPAFVTHCTFEGNVNGAILISHEQLGTVGAGHIAKGGGQYIAWDEYYDTLIEFPVFLTDKGLPYVVQTPLRFHDTANLNSATLHLGPGVRMDFDFDASLNIAEAGLGGIVVNATPGNPAIFSAWNGVSWRGVFIDPTANPVTIPAGTLIVNDAIGGDLP